MLKPGHLCLLVLALGLAGCGTPSSRNSGKPSDWESGDTIQPHFEPLAMQPSSAKPSPAPAPVAWPANDVGEGWITLDHWCQMNHLGLPMRFNGATPATYSLTTPRGTLSLRAGSRSALWDGMEVQLGFAPREVEGKLLVHALDARKNFQPLLEPFSPPGFGNRTVVIDPGHGGGNMGAQSAFDKHWEKEFTLDWALRLRPLLEANGWRVLLTRTNDVEVPLGNRVDFAEQQRADLFLSLHFNSSPDRSPLQSGLETYCVTPRGMASNLKRDYEDDALKTFPNNAYDPQNFQYALRLHRALLAVNGGKDRAVRRARFMGVLLGQHRPAVLIEGGFLSNPTEAGQIADPAYRQRLAQAVADALSH